MSVVPYLRFPGTCFEAMTFYAQVFDTDINMIMRGHEVEGFPVTEAQKDMIAHMGIKFAGGELNASDSFSDDPDPMGGCSVMVALPSKDAAEAAFSKLASGGTITMPFMQMFWAEGFGTVTDRFGVQWMISTEN